MVKRELLQGRFQREQITETARIAGAAFASLAVIVATSAVSVAAVMAEYLD